MEAAARRTHRPVRRNSHLIGTIERDLWGPVDAALKGRAIRAAEVYERRHKPAGRKNGPLGHVALEVYRALWRRVRFSDGCLCPSLAWLMEATGRCKAAVVGALKRLKFVGLLDWRRRMEYIDAPAGERGPQARQCTNAYKLTFPRWVAILGAGPTAALIPADELGRQVERYRQVRAYERAAFDSSPLGLTFDRLGRFVGKRESAKRSPSGPEDLLASGRAAGGGPVAPRGA